MELPGRKTSLPRRCQADKYKCVDEVVTICSMLGPGATDEHFRLASMGLGRQDARVAQNQLRAPHLSSQFCCRTQAHLFKGVSCTIFLYKCFGVWAFCTTYNDIILTCIPNCGIWEAKWFSFQHLDKRWILLHIFGIYYYYYIIITLLLHYYYDYYHHYYYIIITTVYIHIHYTIVYIYKLYVQYIVNRTWMSQSSPLLPPVIIFFRGRVTSLLRHVTLIHAQIRCRWSYLLPSQRQRRWKSLEWSC